VWTEINGNITKEQYCVHVLYLQLGIKLGYRVTKIYGGVCFKQRPFLKEYIELNTRLRNEAKKKGDGLEILCIRL
jgi:hypothetical protein